MTRMTGLLAIAFFAGLVLVLSEVRWFSRRSLIERIRPYAPLAAGDTSPTGILSVASFREVIAPLSRAIGERMARVFGVNEELGLRLERIHATIDVTEHRVRQVGWMAVTFVCAVAMTAGLQLPTPSDHPSIFLAHVHFFLVHLHSHLTGMQPRGATDLTLSATSVETPLWTSCAAHVVAAQG